MRREVLGLAFQSSWEYVEALDKYCTEFQENEYLQQVIQENNYDTLKELVRAFIKEEENNDLKEIMERFLVKIGMVKGVEAISSILQVNEFIDWFGVSLSSFTALPPDILTMRLTFHTMIYSLLPSLDSLHLIKVMEDLWLISKEYQDEASPYDNITPYAIVCLLSISSHFPDRRTNPVIQYITNNMEDVQSLGIVFASVFNRSGLTCLLSFTTHELLDIIINYCKEYNRSHSHTNNNKIIIMMVVMMVMMMVMVVMMVMMMMVVGGVQLRHSLMFMKLIFSDYNSANYFYINDLRVIIDIILRELVDLNETDNIRIEYLHVLFELLNNCTDYIGILHRKDEIKHVLQTISQSDVMIPNIRSFSTKIITHCHFLFNLQNPLTD